MLTTEQQTAIAEKLASMHLPAGLGNEENACSIAAINLALSGKLTDKIPDCMSEVIGGWIIEVQDSMPDEMRNSVEWKSLLPLAAGTGREKEKERQQIILDWMWGTVLPPLQPLADEKGFGEQWKQMITDRTLDAAYTAWDAAWDAYASRAAMAATEAAREAAADSSRAAWEAAYAARSAAAGAGQDSWETFDPCGLLDRLIRA